MDRPAQVGLEVQGGVLADEVVPLAKQSMPPVMAAAASFDPRIL
jgi:hypothetical protein